VENDRNSWKMVSQRCVDIERQGMDTIVRGKTSLLLNSLKKGQAERGLYEHNNTKIKEKHSMVEYGNLEIEGYHEKRINWNFSHMQKGGGIELHFEM
jgi:hypothetical protein